MQDESFPSIPQALILCLALFLINCVIGFGLFDIRRTIGLSQSAIWALTMLLANGAVFVMLMHHKRMTYRQLFHPSPSSVRATAALLIPPVLLVTPALLLLGGQINQLLEQWFPLSEWEQRMFASMGPDSLASIVAACILAPVLEEMLFRGIFLRAFLVRYPRGLAIGASALIFGVMHLNLYQFVSAFTVGLFAGWLYERSRSLVAPIALHFFYNSAITALTLAYPESETQTQTSTEPAAIIWAVAGLCALLGAGLLYGMFGRKGRTAAT